jgi:hypothetical protein
MRYKVGELSLDLETARATVTPAAQQPFRLEEMPHFVYRKLNDVFYCYRGESSWGESNDAMKKELEAIAKDVTATMERPARSDQRTESRHLEQEVAEGAEESARNPLLSLFASVESLFGRCLRGEVAALRE